MKELCKYFLMKIHPIITHNELQNIFYIIEYGDKNACVIDPYDVKMTQEFLEERWLELQKIIITHEHDDHYCWVVWLDCEDILAGEKASREIPLCFSDELWEGDIIVLDNTLKLKVIDTPGHTFGHISLELNVRIDSEGNGFKSFRTIAIFVGDTIFPGWVGNTYSGDTQTLFESIQKFESYDDDVTLYSGHDYLGNNFRFIEENFPEKKAQLDEIRQLAWEDIFFTKLLHERSINPFIWCNLEEFTRLRKLRNNF